AARVARVFRYDQRGRREDLDRAMRHVSQIADGSAYQVQSPRAHGRRSPEGADPGIYAACCLNFSARAGLPTLPIT
ncbi:MAG: hypothetical protein QOD47_1658, partial [Gemmatimonadaceae bacterium]|nr:hypothetical protein [Gemmatimonadaceae bacterium]